MKAEELMIGDWVLMDKNYSEEDPMYTRLDYQPYQIQNGEDIDLSCETNCIGDADVYQPIPLTPEILERNGFIYDSRFPNQWLSYGSSNKKAINKAIYVKLTNDKEVRDIYLSYNYDILIIESNVLYVHELQHALKLCGIEKEITL